MTTAQFLSKLLDQMALINETVNDILDNFEKVMESQRQEVIKQCDCCKRIEETLCALNSQRLCRNCYEEYKDMFN